MFGSVVQNYEKVNSFILPVFPPHTPYPIPQLGNTTKSVNPPLEKVENPELILKRLERWQLQKVAGRILERLNFRVSSCFRQIIQQSNVGICLEKSGEAHYKGLLICGSVWVCPVCAAKISERRRSELVEAVSRWKEEGGTVYFLTLTAPHHRLDDLKCLLRRFSKARGLFKNRKAYKKWALSIGLKGSVRALEVTDGGNGWHVHTHELLFCKSPVQPWGGSPRPVSSDILPAWQKACVDAGLEMPNTHGLSIEDGVYAAKYASKWGIESELTKAHIKKGREGRLTPFDLLREVLNVGCADSHDSFTEYAKAFYGKRQLVWSAGLRSLLKLEEEKSDIEVAEEEEEGSVLLGSLTVLQWKVILSADKRGELLRVAKNEGWQGVLLYIEILIRS